MTQDPQPASTVEARLQAEIEEQEARLVDIAKRLQAAEAKANAAEAAWSAANTANPGRLDQPEDEIDTECHRTHQTLMNLYDAQRSVQAKLKQLRDPAELERRNDTSAKMAHIRKEYGMAKKPTPREQGVPDIYLNESGNFKIGKDARYKSDLVLSALGLITTAQPGDSLQVYEAKDAEKRLQARGWTKFLDRKREILVAQQTAKDARIAEREQKAREKAAEKAAAKAAKAEAKTNGAKTGMEAQVAAEQAAHDATEAKPDPKPTSSKGRSKAKA